MSKRDCWICDKHECDGGYYIEEPLIRGRRWVCGDCGGELGQRFEKLRAAMRKLQNRKMREHLEKMKARYCK